ncbi:hypothetical protein ACK83U_00880 [Rhizobium sp. WW22]|uniref:hypothetical protein n=1 Tax=Rhizobium sp. WW22 TaxID=3389070 RepID=UPI00399A8966
MTFDGKVFGEEIVGAVRLYVAKVTDPLVERLAEIERRLDDMSRQRDQSDIEMSAVRADIAKEARAIAGDIVAEARTIAGSAADELLRAIPLPKDGASVTVDDVRPLIDEAVAKAVDAIPVPKDGRPGRDGVGLAGAMIDRDGNLVVTMTNGDLKTLGPVVGKDADQAAIFSFIEEKVAAIPVPKDGRDGVGLSNASIDRDGNLVLTMTNGDMKTLGSVVGKDVDQTAIFSFIEEKVAAIPAPKDGKDGRDGRDGFNLEDFDATLMEDGRTILLSFDRGDLSFKVELAVPAMIYRGVYREAEYQRGDTVTWGGSLWHCDADGTKEKPGDGSRSWTLAAKRGRDGKDGAMLPAKATGPIRVGVPSEAK